MDKLKKVELKYLDEIIPKKLMIRLQKAGVVTIEDLLSINKNEFSEFEFVGSKTIDDFSKLIKLALEEQNYVYSIYKKNSGLIEQSIYERLKDVNIECLRDIIPHKLFKKFIDNGMNDIKSILDTNRIQFSAMSSIGKVIIRLYDEFREKIISEPDFIYNYAQRFPGKKLPMNFDLEKKDEDIYFLDIFKIILNDYFDLAQNEMFRNIILKRFGINSESKSTLEELSIFHSISREYVRRIENENLRKLKDLFLGNEIVKPHCKLKEIAIGVMRSFFLDLKDRKILTKIELISLIKTNYKKDIIINDWPYLECLFFIWGFKNESIRENDFFIIEGDIDMKTLKDVANTVYSFLEKKIKPSSFYEIVVESKKEMGRKDIDNSFFEYAINIIEQIEKIQADSDPLFQLRFEHLTSLRDKAYRVLYEERVPLDSNMIKRKIEHKLSMTVLHRNIGNRSIATQLPGDNRFISIGKSGWALTEWKIDTANILSLIKRVMHSLNRPSSFLEIKHMVSKYREGVNPKSIFMYLNIRKDLFIKVKNSHYILSEWKNSYSNLLVTNSNRRIPIKNSDLNRIVVDAFRGGGFKEMTTNELKYAIKQKNNIGNSTLQDRLPKLNILSAEKCGVKNIYKLKENFEEILEIEKLKKTDLIEKKIIEILNESETNTVLYKDLVKILNFEHGFALGTINYIIKHNFKKILNVDGKNSIAFLENNKNIKAYTPQKDALYSLILGGENDSVEFKSSLRWSYKEKKIDKDLEFVIAKTISGFLNSKGGILLIGVSDEGNILGLENDYRTLNKNNSDGFLLKLNEVVKNYIGKEFFRYLSTRIIKKEDKDICHVNIERSNKPSYVNGDKFFIRGLAGTERLDGKEMVDYISSNWKS